MQAETTRVALRNSMSKLFGINVKAGLKWVKWGCNIDPNDNAVTLMGLEPNPGSTGRTWNNLDPSALLTRFSLSAKHSTKLMTIVLAIWIYTKCVRMFCMCSPLTTHENVNGHTNRWHASANAVVLARGVRTTLSPPEQVVATFTVEVVSLDLRGATCHTRAELRCVEWFLGKKMPTMGIPLVQPVMKLGISKSRWWRYPRWCYRGGTSQHRTGFGRPCGGFAQKVCGTGKNSSLNHEGSGLHRKF